MAHLHKYTHVKCTHRKVRILFYLTFDLCFDKETLFGSLDCKQDREWQVLLQYILSILSM